MLTARLSNKLRIIAPHYWNGTRLHLLSQKRRISCPACNQPVYYRAGSRTPHFAHFAACNVAFTEPESEAHIRSKLEVLRAITRMELRGELEHYLSTTKQIADVWIDSSHPVALEIQLSPISQDEFVGRRQLYLTAGVTDYWYFGKRAKERVNYSISLYKGEYLEIVAEPIIYPEEFHFEVKVRICGILESHEMIEVWFSQMTFLKGVPDEADQVKGILAKYKAVDLRCKSIAENVTRQLRKKVTEFPLRLWDKDRRGGKLYFKTTTQIHEYGRKLLTCGFVQARDPKPYLFYLNTDLGIIFVDYGGSQEVPIWEDHDGLFYLGQDFKGEDYERRVITKAVRDHLKLVGVPTRLSYDSTEPEAMAFGWDGLEPVSEGN